MGGFFYRPLTLAAGILMKAAFGADPSGYHAVSLGLHLAAVAVLFAALRLLWGNLPAFAAAALFSVHPTLSETVSYLGGFSDILCGFFLALSFFFHLRHERSGAGADLAWSATAAACALLSKETALVFPLVVAARVFLCAKPPRPWRVVLLHALLGAAFWTARALTVSAGFISPTPLPARFSAMGTILLAHLRNTFFPFDLKVFYDIPLSSPSDPKVLLTWAGVAAAAALIWLAVRRNREAAFGMVWYAASLLPVSGLFFLLKPTPVAGRYLYIPLMGFFSALAPFLSRLSSLRLPLWAKRAGVALAVLLATALCALTRSYLPPWRDSLSLMWKAHADAPGRTEPLYSMYWPLKDKDLAEIRRAFDAMAGGGVSGPEFHSMFAHLYYAKGDMAEAETLMEKALEERPDAWEDVGLLALIRHNLGKPGEVAALYEKLKLLKTDAPGRNVYLAQIAYLLERWKEAEGHILDALAGDGNDPSLWLCYGRIAVRMGDNQKAARILEKLRTLPGGAGELEREIRQAKP